ncbi:monocarboxylate transporter 12-B-like [Glandiceps talaboti]
MRHTGSLQTEGPDGGWGWMIVLATSFADALIASFAFVISPLFVELRRYFNATAEETSWILSIQYISNALACIGTSTADYIGARKTVMIFGCVASIGMFISSFATSIYFLYASLGLMTGLGFAGCYSTHTVIMARYFPTRFALANSISKLGPAILFFILPPIMQACFDHYGWRGTFLIQSAIFANLCICGALLRPIREVCIIPPKSDNTEEIPKESAAREIEEYMYQNAGTSNCGQTSCVFSYCRGYLVVCQQPRFVAYLVTLTASASVYIGAMIHLIPRASEAQVGTSQQLPFLISIAGIFSLVGRLSGGIIVHLKILSAMATYILSVTLMAIACLIPNLGDTYIGLASLSGLLGLTSGICFPLGLSCIRDIVGKEYVSFSFPMALTSFGIGAIVGPPLAGRIFDVCKNYDTVYYTLGAMGLFSAIIQIPGQIFVLRRRKCGSDIDTRGSSDQTENRNV